MLYDHYDEVDAKRKARILSAQQVLFGRVMRGIEFGSAVEVGPGFGGFAVFCRSRGIPYRAIEMNKRLADQLRQQGIDVIEGDAHSAEMEAQATEVLVLSHVIEHLGSSKEVRAALLRMLRWLRKDGYLVLLFPDVAWSRHSYLYDYTHTWPTTLVAVERMCRDLPMTIVRSGHYVGRWPQGWRVFWLVHKLLPLWLLGNARRAQMDALFAVNGYCIVKHRGYLD